jgi:hypothetical protein
MSKSPGSGMNTFKVNTVLALQKAEMKFAAMQAKFSTLKMNCSLWKTYYNTRIHSLATRAQSFGSKFQGQVTAFENAGDLKGELSGFVTDIQAEKLAMAAKNQKLRSQILKLQAQVARIKDTIVTHCPPSVGKSCEKIFNGYTFSP